MGKLFRKTLVIENGLVVIFIFLALFGMGTWATISYFTPGDTNLLSSEIDRLKTLNASLQSRNNDILRQARDRQQGDAGLRQFQKDVEVERNRLNDIIKKQRADLDNMSELVDAAHRDNRKLKSDLDSAVAERDQLRRSLAGAGAATARSAPVANSVPAVWKGARCIEEARGGKCPVWLPVYGHDAPCRPGERHNTVGGIVGVYASGNVPVPTDQYQRPWCLTN